MLDRLPRLADTRSLRHPDSKPPPPPRARYLQARVLRNPVCTYVRMLSHGASARPKPPSAPRGERARGAAEEAFPFITPQGARALILAHGPCQGNNPATRASLRSSTRLHPPAWSSPFPLHWRRQSALARGFCHGRSHAGSCRSSRRDSLATPSKRPDLDTMES